MNRFRTLVLSTVIGSSLASSMAAPVGAADTTGTLAIVNGIPGTRVDVCLNGKELASRLAYGGKILRDVVAIGSKDLKFFRPDPRTCRGTQVARKQFSLAAAQDFTIVVTKTAPKVLVFDNVFMGEIPPAGTPFSESIVAYHSAAEFATNFKRRIFAPQPEAPVDPVAFSIWLEGDGSAEIVSPDRFVRVRATLPEASGDVASTSLLTQASRRYEVILVGTAAANARFVAFGRLVSSPT